MNQPLDVVQRWMQSVIIHPGGVEAGLAAEATQAHLDIAPAEVEQLINRSRRQTSIERLAVYANAYYARLIECMEAEFPVFRQTVGEDAFADFVIGYLQNYPSRSYTLDRLGADFARYLNETKPVPPAGEPAPGWADFLVDLARLERTFSEVFDGPGVEGKPTLSADELHALGPQRWPEARLKVVPCLQLMSFGFPLNDYYTAMKRGESPPLPAAAESWLAVTRRDYVVRRYELTQPQFVLLAALRDGQTVGEAIAAAAEIYPGEFDQLAAELEEWFRIWAAAPLFEEVVGSEK